LLDLEQLVDVAVVQLGASATTHTQGGLPYGVLYGRIYATSSSGQKSAPSAEVLIGSYDPKQIIDAVFFGVGPLAVAGNIGCPRGGLTMDGFPTGTTMRMEGTSTLVAEQQTGLRDTAAQIGKQLKVGKFKDSRLTADPKFNITLGRAYLDKLVDRFGGSYVLATAAYNAGPNRVRQWMDTYGDPRQADTDVVDWIESIPFDETRNYVQRVMENLQVYRSRLTKGPSRLALDDDLRRAVVN
jgi:hypothetical protein